MPAMAFIWRPEDDFQKFVFSLVSADELSSQTWWQVSSLDWLSFWFRTIIIIII